jgi:WD40 repeat protein
MLAFEISHPAHSGRANNGRQRLVGGRCWQAALVAVAGVVTISAAHRSGIGALTAVAGPSGRVILVSSGTDAIRRWDASSGAALGEYADGDTYGGAIGLSAADLPDGRRLLAAGHEDGIDCWDALTGERWPLAGSAVGTVFSVAATPLPGGPVLIAGAGNDWLVYRWDAVARAPYGPPLAGHQLSVKAVAAATMPDGSVMIASGGDDDTIRRWHAITGNPIGAPLEGHDTFVTALAAAELPDGRVLLASMDCHGTARRWDAVTGQPLGRPWQAHTEWGYEMAAAQVHGRVELVTTGEDNVIRRWDAKTAELIDDSLTGQSAAILTPAGTASMIAAGNSDGTITIHRIPPGPGS